MNSPPDRLTEAACPAAGFLPGLDAGGVTPLERGDTSQSSAPQGAEKIIGVINRAWVQARATGPRSGNPPDFSA